ncbi:MAG TPA: alpha/beta hydrolase [Acidimicrobiales bacterium]|nr:alpha/beta hydrolase [Acidimicrobiales bacterium]
MTTTPLGRGETTANGIAFSYLHAGPEGGPLALCLHGFPDSAWTWRYLLPDLAEAGFHAVAPFMRGYAPTALAPDGRYSTGALVADAVGLHEALGGDSDAVIIGHDWGAAATYGSAAFAPDRFRRVVTGAVPPVLSFMQAMFSFRQLKRSWYIYFFQSPLAEGAVAADDLAFIDGLWADWSPGYGAAEDIAGVKDCLRQPENLAAAISYYRAMFDPTQAGPEVAEHQAALMQPTPQPTLYFHGTDDGCLGAEAITASVLDHLGPGSEIVMVDGAGHFAHVEKPAIVNRRIVDWVTGGA